MAADKGRPDKLQEATPAILVGIRRGLSLKDAAEGAGINYTTLRRYVRRGEDEVARLQLPRTRPRKREAPYVVFLGQYTEALAQGQLFWADRVWEAAEGGETVTETHQLTETDAAGNLVKSRKTTVVKQKGSDWRAAAFALERRYGWTQKGTNIEIEIDYSKLDTDQLERIAQGEDPATVILESYRKA